MRSTVFALAGCAVAAATFAQTPAPTDWHVVVQTGQTAPGFSQPFTPSIFNFATAPNGELLIFAGMAQPPQADARGVWATLGTGSLQPIFRRFDTAPDYENRTFQDLADRVIGPDGTLVYLSTMQSSTLTPTQQITLWYQTTAGRTRLAQINEPAPGMAPGVRLGRSDTSDGAVAILGVDNTGNALAVYEIHGSGVPQFTQGAWFGRPGALQLVAAPGVNAVGVPGTLGSFDSLDMSSSGRVFYSSHAGSVPAAWRWDNGQSTLLAVQGGPVPGLPGRAFGDTLSFLDGAGNGIGLFYANLIPVAGSPSNERGLWRVDPAGTLSLLTSYGASLAGQPTAHIDNPVGIMVNQAGQALFQANLSGSLVGSTLCITSPAGPRIVLRNGQILPEGGGNFQTLGNAWAFNALGQVAIQIQPGFGPQGDTVYAWTEQAGVFRVLGYGDSLVMGPGDIRTVTGARLGLRNENLSDAQRTGLLDNGTLMLMVRFTDGSTAIVSTSIPAPASALPLALGLITLRRRQR